VAVDGAEPNRAVSLLLSIPYSYTSEGTVTGRELVTPNTLLVHFGRSRTGPGPLACYSQYLTRTLWKEFTV
jgi:hypothetical protein